MPTKKKKTKRFLIQTDPNQDDSTFYLKFTNKAIQDVPLYLATVIPQSAFLNSLTTISNLKDATHFLNKLDQLGQLPSNVILVTLDVSSLYTNIPHNKGIDACRHFLNTRDHSSSTIRTETLCDLIRMILTMNIFEFNNNYYIQKHGKQWENVWLYRTLIYSSPNSRQTHSYMRHTSHILGGASLTTFS